MLDTVTDPIGYTAIQVKEDRLERGLFGDHKPVGDGVWELRIDTGPGYRVYYAKAGKQVVILLCGGDKRSQKADIKMAKVFGEIMSKGHVAAAVPARPYMLERLRDPATAAAYINAAAHEDDPGAFLQALRNVAEARGGLTKIAIRAGLNRQQLYRTLSSAGNPELRSLTRILDATGLQLVVTAKPERRT